MNNLPLSLLIYKVKSTYLIKFCYRFHIIKENILVIRKSLMEQKRLTITSEVDIHL